MLSKKKVFVAGHKGLVGSALVRELKKNPKIKIVIRERKELDLIQQSKVRNFFKKEKIDQVYIAAAKVGGIYANNTYPAEFIYQNLMIQTNLINSAFVSGVKKLLFLGSSCVYPKKTKQPITEEQLLTGKFESTNEPYAIAKISGIKMCESYNRQFGKSHKINYKCVMPTNLYGPNDNYDLENSHVLPALIRKFHEAKINKNSHVTLWGTGYPKREFLYVDDLAKACIKIMNSKDVVFKKSCNSMFGHINVGSSKEIRVKELAKIIKKIIGFEGEIKWDLTKPDGMKRKLLDSSKIFKLGWKPEVSLKDGILKTYNDFKKNYEYN